MVGGRLSHSLFREPLALEADRLHSASDDDWNRRLLALMEAGDAQGLRDMLPDFARQARADMGMKHLHWVLGALGDALPAATVHAYEPLYGSGAAVVEFGRA